MAVGSTEHELAEEKVARLNRTHAMLSRINRAIARTPAPQALYDEVCRMAVEEGEFRMAWVGLVDPDAHLVKPVARCGFEDGFLDGTEFSTDDVPEGQSPVSEAIRSGRCSVCNDIERDQHMAPWRMKANARGYRSCASFAFAEEGKAIGVLSLYSGERGFFDGEELRLLSEAIDDISFAVETAGREEQRKRAEEELREYSRHLERMVEGRTKELQEAERMIAVGKTALMVGHDLRNPLQSITYALYQIKEVVKGLPLGIQADQLQTISGAAVTIGDQIEYMDKIVSDLQDYARSLKPRLSEVDLLGLVNTILSTIDVPKNVRVVVDVDETQRMVADPSMIRRVFTSLIVNALQAMPKGGKLTVSATQTKDATFVGFKDTGLGIPRENIDKLGAPLFTTKAKGMGLGLAIGKRMVESHGGTIVFESKVGRGTTVTVKLPHAIEGDRAELRLAERKESSSPHR